MKIYELYHDDNHYTQMICKIFNEKDNDILNWLIYDCCQSHCFGFGQFNTKFPINKKLQISIGYNSIDKEGEVLMTILK